MTKERVGPRRALQHAEQRILQRFAEVGVLDQNSVARAREHLVS